METLPPHRLRRVLDYLYDGEPETFRLLENINTNYRRAHRIFLWLVRNEIKGKKLVEFFQNESGEADGLGILSGIVFILSHIDGIKYKTIKATELRS